MAGTLACTVVSEQLRQQTVVDPVPEQHTPGLAAKPPARSERLLTRLHAVCYAI